MGSQSRVKLLLDTHIWLWSQGLPGRLAPRVQRALADQAHERWLSPVSVWELATLARKGRVTLHRGVEEWVAAAQRDAPWREAPLTCAVALASDRLAMHDDPADRLIAATAVVYGLTLVTSDRRLLELAGIHCLAN